MIYPRKAFLKALQLCLIAFGLQLVTPSLQASNTIVVLLGSKYIQGANLPDNKKINILLESKFNLLDSSKKYQFINEGISNGHPSVYVSKIDEILVRTRPSHVILFLGLKGICNQEFLRLHQEISDRCPVLHWINQRESFGEKILDTTLENLRFVNARILKAHAKLIVVLATGNISEEEFFTASPTCNFLGKLFPFNVVTGDEINEKINDLGISTVYPKLAVRTAYVSAPERRRGLFSLPVTEKFADDLIPWLIPEISGD